MIAYKIVTPERKSFIMSQWIQSSICCKTYNKNCIVEANTKDFGIFCFKTKQAAIDWTLNLQVYKAYEIIKVKPVNCRGKTPKTIIHPVCLNKFYQKLKSFFEIEKIEDVPAGTICYDKVLVLD